MMDLYTSNAFIEIAKTYLNDDRIRLRNVDGWIHPKTDFKKEIHSQKDVHSQDDVHSHDDHSQNSSARWRVSNCPKFHLPRRDPVPSSDT